MKKSAKVKILTGPFNGKIENPALNFNFEPDDFQKHSFYAISQGENVLVTAHTGSGKTAVARYGIADTILRGKKVVYTSPIKTLSNQKYDEFKKVFQEKFSAEKNIEMSVGLMTGDNKINPDADCVVMTTEILRNALFNIGKEVRDIKDNYFQNNFIDSIGCVIFDEVHYINDNNRGHIWEETINLLSPDVILVMLSATIDGAEDFAKWISELKNRPVNLVSTTFRVVPLEHYIYADNEIHKILDNKNNFNDKNFDNASRKYTELQKRKKGFISQVHIINEMVKFLKDKNLLQTIFFSFSRNNCERYAKSIMTSLLTVEESVQVEQLFDSFMKKYEKQYNHITQFYLVKDLMKKGICFHHSGLVPILKEVIEKVFEKGLVKILFATETFAVGVNMPTRTIVFTELEKFTEGDKRILHTAEYKQMAGRAGRRGIDKFGYVIILPLYNFPDRQELRSTMLGKLPHIESKFFIDYSFILKIIQSNTKNLTQFIDGSLFNRDIFNKIILNEKELSKLEENCVDIDSKYNLDTISKLNKFIEFNSLEREYQQMGISLNRKQLKEKRKLTRELSKNKNFKQIYDDYFQFLDQKKHIDYLKNNIINMKNYVNRESGIIIELLKWHGYINNIDKKIDEFNSDDITIKGMIASQINECNLLLLTEMITGDMFNDLDSSEIVSLLGIFINDIKPTDRKSFQTLKCPRKVIDKIDKIHKIIENYIKSEKKLGINIHHYGYWDISYDYVDVGYIWASGGSLTDVFKTIDTYEGNFIRNILKLNNIVHDFGCLSKIYGNLTIIPKLLMIEDLLIRDIVTVNSLYIT